MMERRKDNQNKVFLQYQQSYGIESILTRFFRGIPISPGHCNVILQQKKMPKDARNELSGQQLEFEIMLPSTGIKCKKSLRYLTSSSSHDILQWIDEFEDVAQLAQWKEEDKLEILKEMVSLKEVLCVKRLTSADDIKKKLLHLAVPNYLSHIFYRQMNELRQDEFKRILEYHTEVQEKVNIYCTSINAGVKEKENLLRQTFKNGLCTEAKAFLQSKSAYTVEQMLRELSELEETIIGDSLSNTRSNNRERRQFKESLQVPHTRENRVAKSAQRYCSYHKSRTHDTRDCRQLKKNEEEKRQKPKDGLNAIKEIAVESDRLILKGRMGQKDVDILFDTGTALNFISEDCLAALENIEVKKESKEIIFADGKRTTCVGKTEIEFFIESLNIAYRAKAYILPVNNATLILGTNFLLSEKVIINYREGVIALDGILLEIPGGIRHTYPESVLVNKTNYINAIEITENDKNELLKESIYLQFKKMVLEGPKIGTIPGIKHQIILKEKKIVCKKQYPIPLNIRSQVKEEIDEMVKLGVIEESASPFSSPAFAIKKKDGGIRICNDFRELNSITIQDAHPCANLRDLVSEIGEASIFSKIDLHKGYYQVEIDPEDRHKTAFSLLGTHYAYKKMPFGLVNAPKTFQRAMNTILTGLKNTKVYMDDLLIYSKDLTEHAKHLELLIERLRKNNIKINLEKSALFKKEISYLGFTIDSTGIAPQIDSTKIMSLKKPSNKKQLMKLLGFINWFRPHLRNASELTKDFYQKIKKGTHTIEWNENDDIKLEEIKVRILKAEKLVFPNYDEEFLLQTDASNSGAGAILRQNQGVVGIYSRKFNKTELNYTTPEKEAFAIYLALKHFRIFIFGAKVRLQTDNRNVLFNKDPISSRVARWKILCGEIDIKEEFLKGSQNRDADQLSRLDTIQTGTTLLQEVENTLKQEVKMTVEEIRKNLNDLSRQNIKKIIFYVHYHFGHPGITKTEKVMRMICRFKNIKQHVTETIKECMLCQHSKEFKANKGLVTGIIETDNPWEDLSVDIIGPISYYTVTIKKEFVKIWLLTIQDRHSRFTKIYRIETISSDDVIKALEKYLKEFPKPKSILSDNGTQFISKKYSDFCKENKIANIYSSRLNPQGNGQSERVNLTIMNVFRIYRDYPIGEVIKFAERNINFTFNRAIKVTPFEKAYKINQWTGKPLKNLPRIDRSKNNEQENQRRRDFNYEQGDEVFVREACTAKMSRKWKGPFVVADINKNNGNVQVREENKTYWNSIRNTRLFRRGQTVVSQD